VPPANGRKSCLFTRNSSSSESRGASEGHQPKMDWGQEQSFSSLLLRSPLGANTGTMLPETQAILLGPLEGRETRENRNQDSVERAVTPLQQQKEKSSNANLVLKNTTDYVHRDRHIHRRVKLLLVALMRKKEVEWIFKGRYFLGAERF